MTFRSAQRAYLIKKCTSGERPKRDHLVSKQSGSWTASTEFGRWLQDHGENGFTGWDVNYRIQSGYEVPGQVMLDWVKLREHRDVSGNCERKAFNNSYDVWYIVRCRKCVRCRLSRRNSWLWRAKQEAKLASRMWFVTLTFGPASRQRIIADARLSSQSVIETAYQYSTVYARKCRGLLKVKGAFRYLFSVEKHVDGFPHLHGIIFETRNGATNWKTLHSSWKHGWPMVKLADSGSIYYVCKYLFKENTYTRRIRASLMFGNPPPREVNL